MRHQRAHLLAGGVSPKRSKASHIHISNTLNQFKEKRVSGRASKIGFTSDDRKFNLDSGGDANVSKSRFVNVGHGPPVKAKIRDVPRTSKIGFWSDDPEVNIIESDANLSASRDGHGPPEKVKSFDEHASSSKASNKTDITLFKRSGVKQEMYERALKHNTYVDRVSCNIESELDEVDLMPWRPG